jgi:predicted enzyme related to lactoylglutathione lyase
MAIAMAWTLTGCASSGGPPADPFPPIPSIHDAPTNVEATGSFVWHDLITEDVETAKRFYGELFGWTFTAEADDRLHVVRVNGRQTASLVDVRETEQDVDGGAWFSSVSVSDVDAAAGRAESGGNVGVSPVDLPDRGRYAVVTDPQGAVLVLLRASGGDPVEPEEIGPGEFLWTELWTTDVRAALGYYEDVLGYTSELMADDARQYHLLSHGGTARAGIGQLPPGDAEPAWLPYVAVDDAQAIVDRVAALGGEVIIPPEAMVRGSAAVIADPTGAIFAVQEWPLPDEGTDTGRGGSR